MTLETLYLQRIADARRVLIYVKGCHNGMFVRISKIDASVLIRHMRGEFVVLPDYGDAYITAATPKRTRRRTR